MRLAAILVLVGCGPNPAFDPPTAGGSNGPVDATGSMTTEVVPTSGAAGPTTSGASSGSGGPVSGESSGSTGAVSAGEESSSTGTTVAGTTDGTTDGSSTGAGCPPCGLCEACVGGACVVTMGAKCDQPTGPACETMLYGLGVDGDCLKFLPMEAECMGPGVCDFPCAIPGDVYLDCDLACVRPDHNCVQKLPIEGASLNTVCFVDDMEHPGCEDACVDNGGFPDHLQRRCGQTGKCDTASATDCQYGLCANMMGCAGNMCETNQECTPPAVCVNDMCMTM